MAEIIDRLDATQHIPTNSKTNTALTLGIVGTTLAGLGWMARGGRSLLGTVFGGGGDCSSQSQAMTPEDLYIERKQAQNFIDVTKQYYEGQMATMMSIHKDFDEAYKRDVDNSFNLYKYTRDTKDDLTAKIEDLKDKVEVMAAIRPYQDALINAKIDKNALLADYNLSKRTCRMITGKLVLPSDPTITGYGSQYEGCGC